MSQVRGKSTSPPGVRCMDERCPKCGSVMLREGGYHHRKLEERRTREKKSS